MESVPDSMVHEVNSAGLACVPCTAAFSVQMVPMLNGNRRALVVQIQVALLHNRVAAMPAMHHTTSVLVELVHEIDLGLGLRVPMHIARRVAHMSALEHNRAPAVMMVVPHAEAATRFLAVHIDGSAFVDRSVVVCDACPVQHANLLPVHSLVVVLDPVHGRIAALDGVLRAHRSQSQQQQSERHRPHQQQRPSAAAAGNPDAHL